MVLLCALTFVVVEGMAVQLGGLVASLVFGGHRLIPGGLGAGTGIFLRLWRHAADPALAWSPVDRVSLPGPVAIWASLLVTQLVVVGLFIVTIRLVRHLRGASGSQHGPAKASSGGIG